MNFGNFYEAAGEEERVEYALETLKLSVQIAIQKSMHDNCVTQKELAGRIGVSPARVSQLLSGTGVNLTLKTIVKIADALGEEFELISARTLLSLRDKKVGHENSRTILSRLDHYCEPDTTWVDETANSNKFPILMTA